MKAWMNALITGRSRVLKTAGPFTANTIWTAPVTTTALVSLIGRGSNGTGYYYEPGSFTVASSSNKASQSGGSTVSRADAVNAGLAEAVAKFGGSSSERLLTYTRTTYTVGPDNLVLSSTSLGVANCSGAPAYDYSGTSGNITYSPSNQMYVRVNIDVRKGGSSGSATTGFGYTFAGGTASAPTAVAVTHSNVPVTPGASYSLVIPAGGSITITYYE